MRVITERMGCSLYEGDWGMKGLVLVAYMMVIKIERVNTCSLYESVQGLKGLILVAYMRGNDRVNGC